jgi:hypothetical protein
MTVLDIFNFPTYLIKPLLNVVVNNDPVCTEIIIMVVDTLPRVIEPCTKFQCGT